MIPQLLLLSYFSLQGVTLTLMLKLIKLYFLYLNVVRQILNLFKVLSKLWVCK
jgi:hypothetical protein